MKGLLTYWTREGKGTLKSLRLTVCSSCDTAVVQTSGLAEMRRNRIVRLLDEASRQGARLSYKDLSLILLTSKATLKRDMKEIRKQKRTESSASDDERILEGNAGV